MSDTLVFGDADPVTGQPIVNGFVFPDIGVTTTESEPGYVNGGRVELGGSGLAPVVIQSVQDGSTIVLGIMCRGDSSFDDLDTVIIALRGNGGAQRRIDIGPVNGNDGGALDLSEVGQTGLGAASSVADLPDIAAGTIFTNRNPHIGPTFYERPGPSGNWNLASAPPGFECKVRSWRPLVTSQSPSEVAWSLELRIPISAAGWITLGDEFGIFIDVIRCFRSQVDVDGTPVAFYDSTQYTFPPNQDLPDQIDATTDIPSASFARGLRGAMVSQGQGVRFKGGAAGVGNRPVGSMALTNAINAKPLNPALPIPPDNQIIAQLENTGPAVSGIVAEVRMANWGINAPNFFAWQLAPGCDPESAPVSLGAGTPATPGTPAAPSAMVETVNAWPTLSVPPEYQPPRQHQCMWVQLRGTSGTVVFSQSSVRRNMDFTGFSQQERQAEIAAIGYPKPEDGSGEQEFMLRTRCRKIVVSQLIGQKELSDETTAIVGGVLQHATETGMFKRDDFRGVGATTHVAAHDNQASTSAFKDVVVYLWITEGLRRTGKTLIVNGIKTRVWDNSPGDFSLAAFHKGIDDPMGWELSGAGLIKRGDGVYGIRVKDGDTASITVKVGAGPEIKPGDTSKLPRRFPGEEDGGNGDGPGKDPKNPEGDGGTPTPGGKIGCPMQALLLALVPAALYAVGSLIA